MKYGIYGIKYMEYNIYNVQYIMDNRCVINIRLKCFG